MNKKNSLLTLATVMAFALTAFTASAAIKDIPATGIAECDQLIELTKQYEEHIPAELKERVESEMNQLVALAKEQPEAIKTACAAGLAEIPAEMK